MAMGALDRITLAIGEDALYLTSTDVWAIGELSDVVTLSSHSCSLEKVPGKQNWVDQGGGLPNYICHIARALHREKGMPVSRSIAIAVGRVKAWAAGGGDVDADTRAKAAKAVAEWEALKAKAAARRVKKASS